MNGDRSLSFLLPKSPVNEIAFDMVEEEAALEYNDVDYRIKSVEERVVGQTPVKIITAPHTFFDIVDEYRYGLLADGTKSINEILSFIFTDTPWTFSVIDPFDSLKFEEFGNDNCLALFQQALERYRAEFDIVGNDVKIYSTIGGSVDLQFRYNHNVKTLKKNVDTSNLSTYIKGYGKKIDDPYIFKNDANYTNIAGTWPDVEDPYHYASAIGGYFEGSFTGSKLKFRHYSDNRGGVWEFVLSDGKKKRISTWASKEGVKTVDIFTDLPDAVYTVKATFKGDDPNHKPSTGKNTSRGWVCHGATYPTFQVFRYRTEDEKFEGVAEYTSPYADRYPRLKHAPPYQSDSVTNSATLLKRLKSLIKDKPELTLELEFVVLKDAGYNVQKPRLGDIIPTIYEPLNIDLDLRVLDIEEYPESNKSPKVTLSTSKKSLAKATFSYQKAVLDKLWDANSGKIRYNVYDEAVRLATEALNNSLTELEYPAGMGILARDPNDPSRFVALRSAGLGVTTDGGESFGNAITADGVTTNLLTAGQIKTNNIQIIGTDDLFYWDGTALMAISTSDANKYVKLNSDGLYIAKGALTIERPDGAKFIQDGIPNMNLGIQPTYPPFLDPNGAVELYSHNIYRTNATDDHKNMGWFTFNHDSRYLVIHAAYYVSVHSGSYSGGLLVKDGSDNSLLASKNFTNQGSGTDLASNGEEIVIDLGKPTYQKRSVYLQIKSSYYEVYAYCRLLRMYQKG